MKLKKLLRPLAVGLPIALAGCNTLVTKPPIDHVSDEVYVNQFTDEQRAEYDEKVPEQADRWFRKRQVDYLAEKPVHFGEGQTAGTILWNRLFNEAAVYRGHITHAMGMEISALVIYQTEDNGMPKRQANGKPVVVMTQPFSQEATGRFVAKLGTQFLSAVSHGSLAAHIRAESCEDGNCAGDTILNNSSAAVSAADADADSNQQSSTSVDFCATCF